MGFRDNMSAKAAERQERALERAEDEFNALTIRSVIKQMRNADMLSLTPNDKGRDMAVVEAVNANTKATLLLLREVQSMRLVTSQRTAPSVQDDRPPKLPDPPGDSSGFTPGDPLGG